MARKERRPAGGASFGRSCEEVSIPPFGSSTAKNVIAIVMLDNRLLRRQTRSVRAVVVQDLGSHCAEKGFRELRQTGVSPLQTCCAKK